MPLRRPHSPSPPTLHHRACPPAGNPLLCQGSCPMAASSSCLVGGCGGGLPGFVPSGRHDPCLLSRYAILCILCRCRPRLAAPPTTLLQSLPPPLLPLPRLPRRSNCRFCLRYLTCLFPPCGTPPLLRCFLSACVTFYSVACTPVMPSLLSLPSCYFPPPSCRLSPLLRPCSSPLT